jgi:hypothetical protein
MLSSNLSYVSSADEFKANHDCKEFPIITKEIKGIKYDFIDVNDNGEVDGLQTTSSPRDIYKTGIKSEEPFFADRDLIKWLKGKSVDNKSDIILIKNILEIELGKSYEQSIFMDSYPGDIDPYPISDYLHELGYEPNDGIGIAFNFTSNIPQLVIFVQKKV